MQRTETRGTREVIEDHLERRRRGDLEGDLEHNYDRQVVCLSLTGVRHGWDGIREQAAELNELVPDGKYRYREVIVAGGYGLLVWGADSPDAQVREGTDSFVVRHGRIVAQTVHYHVHDGG